MSPYAEKIRLMLAYADIQWQSCIVPPMPPRPTLDPLLAGYRRIPVAQIGADIFCDTRIIAEEIARTANKPELSYLSAAREESEFATYVNETLFMPIVQSSNPPTVLRKLITQYWPWQIFKLLKDRAGVGKTSQLPPVRSAQRKEIINDYKEQLESKSAKSAFLFGEQPTIADFAAYHPVWFANETQPKDFLQDHPQAKDWQTRMSQFSKPAQSRIKKAELFTLTKQATPREVPESYKKASNLGKPVSISPSDYALDATSGTLVGEDEQRWIISRESQEFGTIHVHFPKHGYQLTVS